MEKLIRITVPGSTEIDLFADGDITHAQMEAPLAETLEARSIRACRHRPCCTEHTRP